MNINIKNMSEDDWHALLVPDHDGMARVGGFLIDETALNLHGLLDIYNKAVDEAKVFALLVGMAETTVQALHLRDDPDALEKLKLDQADHVMRAALENTDKDNNDE